MNHLRLWNEFLTNPTEENKILILNEVNNDLKRCIEYFTDFYKNPQSISKFRNKSNVDKLLKEINKVKVITHLKNDDPNLNDSWGYVFTNNLYTIYINYFNFFNNKVNANIYDTILHEMGHLIDFQLRRLGEIPSYMEPSILRPQSEPDFYIISREEDYARIQRLRNIFKLNPIGTFDEIADKINEFISSNRISVAHLELKISPDKKKLIVVLSKNFKSLTLGNVSYILGNLVIDDYLATDIGYLFAKYAKLVNQNILEIDLVKINNVNNTFVNDDNNDNYGNLV
jgi:Rad3-related DNA helicase